MLRFILIAASLSWISCNSDKNPPHNNNGKTNYETLLSCSTVANQKTPTFAIVLNVPKKRVLSTVNQCSSIPLTEYAQYQIPQNAKYAYRGQSAKKIDYFYILQPDKNKHQVYRGQVYEEKAIKNYNYKHILNISKTNEVTEMLKLPNLSGLYSQGGLPTSWFMIIKQQGNQLDVEFFEVDGILPPDDYIYKNIDIFKKQKLKEFQVDAYDLSFTSNLGNGQFLVEDGNYSVVFDEKIISSEEPLKLFFKSRKE